MLPTERRGIMKSFWIGVSVVAAIVLAFIIMGQEPSYHVVGVHDGDTITVLTPEKRQIKVRLAEIDCPETKQPYGSVAKKTLSEKIFDKDVTVKFKGKPDKWGRSLAIIYLNGKNINLEMIQDGLAWHYKSYSKSKEFADAEKEARSKRKGLWSDKRPIPPWEFRK